MRMLAVGLSAIAVAVAFAGCGGTSVTTTSTEAAQVVTLTVLSPPNGSVINANSVTVRGTVSPANATVEVAGQPAAVGNGVFTASANLQVGKTTIDVIGSAADKSPGSASIVVTRPGSSSSPSSGSGGTGGSGGSGATPGVAGEQPSSVPPSTTSCGGGLAVGPDTTCSFAANVQAAYDGQGPGTYSVHSPVTDLNYTMTCNQDGGEIVCTGGNNASVYFPAG